MLTEPRKASLHPERYRLKCSPGGGRPPAEGTWSGGNQWGFRRTSKPLNFFHLETLLECRGVMLGVRGTKMVYSKVSVFMKFMALWGQRQVNRCSWKSPVIKGNERP